MPDIAHDDNEKTHTRTEGEVEPRIPISRASTRDDDGAIAEDEKSAGAAPGLPPPVLREDEVDDDDVDVGAIEAQRRGTSRASSTRSRALSVVPRSQRRGLLAKLAVIPEVQRPYDYSNRTKWTITLIVAVAAAAAPMGSAIFYRESLLHSTDSLIAED